MREILFRAKRMSDGEWVDGSLFIDEKKEKHEILIGYVNYRVSREVDPNTVGQFTGLTDKNGKKIFDGDIIRSSNGRQSAVSVVKYGAYKPDMVFDMFRDFIGCQPKQPMYGLFAQSNKETVCLFDSPHLIEVIGNIHDNPELLYGGGDFFEDKTESGLLEE